MADKMLIDAAHPEETRVVVVRGNRVEEFDFESANRKQLRGNIYLAKVTRVEPSLQAAFVDYGGNRHGFLAFSEIHPDYYQIPVADRQALLAQEEHDQRAAEAEAEHRPRGGRGRGRHRSRSAGRRRSVKRSEPVEEASASEAAEAAALADTEVDLTNPTPDEIAETTGASGTPEPARPNDEFGAGEQPFEAAELPAGEDVVEATPPQQESEEEAASEGPAREDSEEPESDESERTAFAAAETPEGGEDHAETGDHLPMEAAAEQEGSEEEHTNGNGNGEENGEDEDVESVGGADALEEVQERLPRFRRQYKIQEVIKRRQVLLVQVVKEERGTKGAALTTYLSLAGRYSVLMPNTARGGGISRKITSAEDRNRLKEIASDLEVPEGMGVILRTAGASRTKTEVKRDFEYLLRLWETVRDLTLKSTAPTLVYEEGSLIKRSIRDLYNKDIDEITVAGEDGYKEARDFMRMLMPSHVKNVKQYKDTQPLFTRYGIENQLDAMFSPVVQLKSGGYIVINQAEALVAIDVNSGRATREHHIEDTALKTNIEAAEEIARQLRLRDLAGLIVIDFIDMDETRNNRNVERKLKEALKHDRARIQVGRISHFGLLEMSRQRIRSSVLESSTEKCAVCGGSGHVRSVSSVALQALRALEEMLIKGATHNLIVRTRSEVALYMLNHKRAHLRELEERFRVTLTVSADETVTGQQSYVIDRGEQVHSAEAAKSLAAAARAEMPVEEAVEAEEAAEAEAAAAAERAAEEEEEGGRRRRRRRGRGGRSRGRNGETHEEAQEFTHDTVAEHAVAHEDHDDGTPEEFAAGENGEQAAEDEAGEQREGRQRRRRGRRGGRRNRRGRNGETEAQANGGEPAQEPEHAAHETHVGSDFPPVSEEDADAMAPPFDREPEQAAPAAEAVSPEAAPAQAAPEAAQPAHEAEPAEEEPAPSRRRSTVREPAPFASEGEPPTLPPTPTPVISSTGAEEPAAPRRGWWARRLMGDKD
jgi:ribonuclease E